MDKVIDLKKLKKYMDENNISEFQLSKIINVSYSMVNRVFRGKRNPGAKFLTGLLESDIDPKFFLKNILPVGKSTNKTA